jgi:hypothetical protein
VAAGLLAALPAGADDLTIVSKMTRDGGEPTTATSYLSSDHARMVQPDGQEAILDLKTGQITVIDGRKKEYFVVTRQDMDQMKAKLQQTMNSPEMQRAQEQMKNLPPEVQKRMQGMMGGAAGSFDVKKMGTTRKIAGYNCDNWTITLGQFSKTEQCVTTELPVPVQSWDAYRDFADGHARHDGLHGAHGQGNGGHRREDEGDARLSARHHHVGQFMGRSSSSSSEVSRSRKARSRPRPGKSRPATRRSTTRCSRRWRPTRAARRLARLARAEHGRLQAPFPGPPLLVTHSGERRGLAHRLVPGQLGVVGVRLLAHAVAMRQLVPERSRQPEPGVRLLVGPRDIGAGSAIEVRHRIEQGLAPQVDALHQGERLDENGPALGSESRSHPDLARLAHAFEAVGQRHVAHARDARAEILESLERVPALRVEGHGFPAHRGLALALRDAQDGEIGGEAEDARDDELIPEAQARILPQARSARVRALAQVAVDEAEEDEQGAANIAPPIAKVGLAGPHQHGAELVAEGSSFTRYVQVEAGP